MNNDLDFVGRVAVVTGAGAGIGREHALCLAKGGAKVVVNDLGGDIHGQGSSLRAADMVVEEIRSKGGEAVANYDSVENGDRIVETAMHNFGRIDIVINNAGIIRDKSFHKMSDEEWDQVYSVHVRGAYKTTRAAWNFMRDQAYGRIIFTSSASGIYGNFGQTNYSMAKLGTYGLCRSLSIEGANRNINVNTIAPVAASRMAGTVMTQEQVDCLKPEHISPFAAYLCHQSCTETGGLFEVGAGWMGKLRWERAQGHGFPQGQAFTINDVRDNWERITDYSTADHPDTLQHAVEGFIARQMKDQ